MRSQPERGQLMAMIEPAPIARRLVGMDDRVTALGGRLNIESPAGGGTVVAATMPLRTG